MTALLLAAGVGLRTLMLFSPKSFWGDEWFSIALARQGTLEVLRGSVADVHPPLYFLVLHAVTGLLGGSEWAFRLPSFLAGAGLLAALAALTREIYGPREGRIALFLAALSPYWLQSSNEVRSYSLFGFLVTLGTFLFLRALARPASGRWASAYAAVAVVTIYVEHYAWFWLAALTACLGWIVFHGERKTAAARLARFHRVALFVSFPSLGLIAYQAVFREHMFAPGRVHEYTSVPLIAKKVLGIFWHFTNGYQYSMITVETVKARLAGDPFFWLSALSALAATALAARTLRELFVRRRELFVLGSAVLAAPVAFLAVVYPIRLDARYLVFAAPFFFVLAARGAAASGRAAAGIFLFTYALVAGYGSARAVLSPTDAIHKEDYRALVVHVLDHAAAADAVCGLGPQAEYYQRVLDRRFRAAYFAELSDLPPSGPSSRFRLVWVMDGSNMHPDVAERQRRALVDRFAGAGYEPAGPAQRFGGEEAITTLYLFRPRSGAGP